MKEPALYELSKRIAGFDFFIWGVQQKAAGAERIAFDTRNPSRKRWAPDVVMRRYESILKPGAALLGMEGFEGTEGRQYGGYTQPELIAACKAGLKVPRLKSVLPPGKERYTVTLRKDARLPHRDSDEAAWCTFAAEIGALVIRDYDVTPIDLHERMALYAGSEMNFFVTNGPVMLCFLSEYPAMGFDVQNSPPQGIEPGGQYPWLIPGLHRQIWEDDDLPVIRREFDNWRRGRWV